MSQEECARLRESVPYVKVYRYNPKHLYPKLNGYGYNGQRKVRSSCGSTYCTSSADALRVHQNAQSAKLNQYFNTVGYSCDMYSAWKPKDDYGVNASAYVVQCNGFSCHSYVNYMLGTDINITETTYSCQF